MCHKERELETRMGDSMAQERNKSRTRYILVVAMLVVTTSVIAEMPSAEATTYDVIEKFRQTRISIKGDDYTLDGKLFRPAAEGRFPLVVLNHGTCGERCRKRYKRSRMASPARVFAGSGYVAYTVNRIGYGKSDGYRGYAHNPYAPTAGGGCKYQDYATSARKAGLQVRRVIESLVKEVYVDPGRTLAVGQSGGGLAVLGLTEGPQPHGHLVRSEGSHQHRRRLGKQLCEGATTWDPTSSTTTWCRCTRSLAECPRPRFSWSTRRTIPGRSEPSPGAPPIVKPEAG